MTLKDIVAKFKEEAESQYNCGIECFKFGFLSELVNADKCKSYPMALLQPPDSSIANIELIDELLTFDLYLFDIDHAKDGKDQSRIWSELHHMGITLLRRVCSDIDYPIIGAVSVDRDASLHNDKLVGVHYTFNMQVNNDCGIGCICIEDGLGNTICEIATGDEILASIDDIPTLFSLQVSQSSGETVQIGINPLLPFSVDWGDGNESLSVTPGSFADNTYGDNELYDVTVNVDSDDYSAVLGSFEVEGKVHGVLDLRLFTSIDQLAISHATGNDLTNILFPNNEFTDVVISDSTSDFVGNWDNVLFNQNNTTLEVEAPLSQANVNNLLIDLDGSNASGFTGRSITIINSATPTGDGITAKNSLISKGFTVIT